MEDDRSEPSQCGREGQLTRREYIAGVGATVLAGPVLSTPVALEAAPSRANVVKLRINTQQRSFALDPRVTLLDLLREQLSLTGTKKGCDHGQCGACTVLVNGRRINSCLSLAVSHDGDEITTIEGLAGGGSLHPLQAAFIEQDGFQCGYCTPGQICSAMALIEEFRRGDASFITDLSRSGRVEPTDSEIRERMSGNICRCGAYPGILAAVKSVADLEISESKL